MADINKLIPLILKWEGGFCNEKYDKGGATNKGITLTNWKIYGYDKDGDGDIDVDDLKIITNEDFMKFFKTHYWEYYWKADNIKNQSIANILVDWCYNSGGWGVKIPQQLLGVVADGKVGPKTLDAVNNSNQQDFFNKIWNARKEFYNGLVAKNPTQKVFLKGWLNRLNDYKFYN
jgi:lysozyme family protein